MQDAERATMVELDRPIFAIGMPRSGTTWIGKILDSHPRTLYRHEPDTWQRLRTVPLFAGTSASAVQQLEIRQFVGALPGVRADRVCGKRPIFPKDYASTFAVRRYAAMSLVEKALGRVGIEMVSPLPPQPGPSERFRLAVKSIESLGRLGTLVDSIPEARYVLIVRHPCGFVSSVLRGEAQQRFGHNEAAHDYELLGMACGTEQARRHGITLDLLRSLTPAERLAWRWVIFNEKAADETRGRADVYTLIYEQLCWDPLDQARRLFDFCGLDWNEQTERFVRSSTSSSKPDYYSVFKDPMGSAWRWRAEMDPQDIHRVTAVVRRSSVASMYFEPSDWARGA
jgi:hypothetical protein